MSYDFDGVDDVVSWGNLAAFNNLSELSVHLSFDADTVAADGTVFCKRFDTGGALDGFILFVDATGFVSGRTSIISLTVDDGVDNVAVEGATNSVNTSGWQTVGFSFEGGSATGLRLYVDGVEDANSPADASSVSDTGSDTSSVVTGTTSSTTRDLNGRTAKIGAWNRILTAREFAGLNAGYSPAMYPNGLIFHAELVNNPNDLISGTIGTAFGNAAPSPNHPRIIQPVGQVIPFPAVAGSPAVNDYSAYTPTKQFALRAR